MIGRAAGLPRRIESGVRERGTRQPRGFTAFRWAGVHAEAATAWYGVDLTPPRPLLRGRRGGGDRSQGGNGQQGEGTRVGSKNANRIRNPMLAVREIGRHLDSPRRCKLSAPILPRLTLNGTCATHTATVTVRGLIYTRSRCYG